MTNRNPWLASAKRGATMQTYEIRTVSDFLKVPESRRRICLREFDAWLTMQEGIPALIHAAAESLGAPKEALDILFKDADVFRWIDDGKATISVSLETHEEPRTDDAVGQSPENPI